MAQFDRPNVLLLVTDQHRFDFLGYAGHPQVHTPHLDALAAQSLNYRQAYTPSPICGPARVCLFTGRSALETGIHRNWIPVPEHFPLLSERLRDAGYQTALVGKLHISPVANRHGFTWRRICDSPHDVYDPEETRINDYIPWAADRLGIHPTELTRRAGESERISSDEPGFWLGWSWAPEEAQIPTWTADMAIEFLGHKQESPWFLNVSFFGPHHPYALCEPWDSAVPLDKVLLSPLLGRSPGRKFIGKHFPNWPESIWRAMTAKYLGQIAAIDYHLGRVFQALRDSGQWHNTLIVFTSDHGDLMGDYSMLGKGNMLEGSVRVPLLVKAPGVAATNHSSHRLTSLCDLYPTILDYAGAATPKEVSSSLRQSDERTDEVSSEVVSSFVDSEIQNGELMLIQGDWKLVRHLHEGKAIDSLHCRSDPFPDDTDYSDNPKEIRTLQNLQKRLDAILANTKS